MNSKIFWKFGLAINLSLLMVFCDFSKFKMIPTAIATTSNSSFLGCWITSYKYGKKVYTHTMQINRNNRWTSELKYNSILSQLSPIRTSGKWYIQGYQLVTEDEAGAKGAGVLISPNNLQWGDLIFSRCNP